MASKEEATPARAKRPRESESPADDSRPKKRKAADDSGPSQPHISDASAASDSAPPAAKRPRTSTSSVGSTASVTGKKGPRRGSIAAHDPDDKELSYKLIFDDGKDPKVDWFRADEVEVESMESVGMLAQIKDTGRVGKILVHHPNNATLTYKLQFEDGKKPPVDWVSEANTQVQSTLETLRHWREKERVDLKHKLHQLQADIKANFREYKKRLQILATGNTATCAGKILVGVVPAAHAVTEALSGVKIVAEVNNLINECSSLAELVGGIADMYESHSTDVARQEAELLSVLSRSVKFSGESYVIKGKTGEPAERVIKNLIDIKAVCARLEALDEMGFLPEDPSEQNT